MFDRYHRHSSYQTTTINQQPHDAADAARLYGELQKEAEGKIKNLVCEQLSGLNASFATFEAFREPYEMQDRFHVCWKLNGQAMSAKITVGDHEKMRAENPRLLGLRKIAESITEVILDRLILEYHASQRFMK